MADQQSDKSVPLSADAQDAKELMQQQLLRKMANKMMAEAIEEERQRRIKAEQELEDDTVRRKAFDQLIVVQEDLVRCLNRMKVKALEELERGQRITEEKKRDVHDELLRKATAKEVKHDIEEERKRLIAESKDENSDVNVDRRKTYEKLVVVQEDLLKTIQGMRVDEEMRQEQQRRITEDRKLDMQEQLVHEVSKKQAAAALEKEKERRVEESQHLSNEEIQRRLEISHKMLDVQKELLATHPPTEPIHGVVTGEVLEEAKFYMQEQLLRKAHQKEAIQAMEDEKKRRVEESPKSPLAGVPDTQAYVLEQIVRKANVKVAKEMADAQQQEYIVAEQKARVQEDTVRKIHQKEADSAMEAERKERIHSMEGKPLPHIDEDLKKGLREHPLSPK